MNFAVHNALPVAVLDVLPNPVFVKDAQTRYVWVNQAFEGLFDVEADEMVGTLDTEVFQQRQAVQCNGGDLRVLETGHTDEAYETMIDPELGPREMITRKSRLAVDGEHFLVGVMHDITDVSQLNEQLVEQAAELHRLASVDSLTGCLNRRALFEDWSRRRPGVLLGGLAVVDIDHFKAVNDQHGHAGGDAVLNHVVDLIRANLRPTDVLARIGGEEFAVVLPGTTVSEVERVLERVRQAVEESPAIVGGARISATVSIGAIHGSAKLDTELDTLLAEADRELYRAKENGRNVLCYAA